MKIRVLALIGSVLLPVSSMAETNTAPVKDLGGGIFQVGAVYLNQQQKTVTFPAVVNMQTGLVEYAVVTSSGKTHESVLKTDAQPVHIHTAMLLLGARTATTNDTSLFYDRTRQIPGERVLISAEWEGKGPLPIERLVFNKMANEPMVLTNWVYNGSQTINGRFLAQQDGSIVSLIADASALVNNTRSDRENDELWVANTNTIPAVGTPVQVTIRFAPR